MSKAIALTAPLSLDQVRSLAAGDEVRLSGIVVTARDAAHRYLVERDDSDGMPFDLGDGVIYHCGPIMRRVGARWEAVSAGPTTSDRMEIYEPRVIDRYRVRAILGKGGMGPATAEALKVSGAVYLAAASGAGALLARKIVSIKRVWKLEDFGEPEAMWELEVRDFPAIVAMDTRGGNLYAEVERRSAEALATLRGKRFGG